MSSQVISTSTESFCNKLPYEVLAKIFTHCLSQSPLNHVQPNTKIAPMLLCQVCSHWRTVALTTATLWSHLRCRLPMQWDHTGHPFISPADIDFWKNAMDFLRWWKRNHGPIPPFLRISDHPRSAKPRPDSEMIGTLSPYAPREELELLEQKFLLDYLSSAQYLDTHLLYRYLTVQAVKSGTHVMCPNLHTLVTVYSTHIQIYDTSPSMFPRGGSVMHEYELPFVPLQLPPTLRRLSFDCYGRDYQLGWMNDPPNWSSLTHLTMTVEFTASDWFSTIRAVPRLQRGRFYLTLSDINLIDYTPSTNFSLPMLSTLFVRFSSLPTFERPFGALFCNLEFPVLQEMHLDYASACSWWDARTASELTALLRCTPVITSLTLGGDCVQSIMPATGDNRFDVPASDIKPLSWHTPLLTHLEVHLQCTHDIAKLDTLSEQFVRRIFHSWPWLDFASPASTIRTVAIVVDRSETIMVDRAGHLYGEESERLLKASIVRNVRKNINKVAGDVTFKFRLARDSGQLPPPDEILETWTV